MANAQLQSLNIIIPDHFLNVQYNEECYPGAVGLQGFEKGANCQHFSYELLRYFGCVIPDFRSSDLWEDEDHTYAVTKLEPLDLVMFSKDDDCWGAHVGVYVGQDTVLHLSKKIGVPAFEPMRAVMDKPEYKVFIGAKRCRIRG